MIDVEGLKVFDPLLKCKVGHLRCVQVILEHVEVIQRPIDNQRVETFRDARGIVVVRQIAVVEVVAESDLIGLVG